MKQNKYSKWYYNIIANAQRRVIDGFVHIHHIIPLSIGGKDVYSNTARLLPREHWVCHLLLLRFTEGDEYDSMVYAASMLINVYKYKVCSTIRNMIKSEMTIILKKRKGNIWTDEQRALASSLRKGIRQSPGTISKMKQYKKTPEHLAKISAALKGRKVSPETLLKRRQSYKPRPPGWFHHSDETKALLRQKRLEVIQKTLSQVPALA